MAPTRKLFAGLAISATLLGSVATLSGCKNEITMEEFKAELVKSGMTDKLAQCAVDELNKKGFKLKKYGELSAEDTKMLTDAGTTCALKDSGLDPSTLTTLAP